VPRAGLSHEAVVVEAERIADDVGLSRLTLAALAASLGVRQPSLYKHIEGMSGLQRSIAVRAKNELADALGRAAVGRARGDAIRAVASTYRHWALRHPGRYAATVRAPKSGDLQDEAASAAAVRVVLQVLSGYRLHGDAAIDATRALRSALHGFVSLEACGGFGLPVDIDRSFERLVEALISALDVEAETHHIWSGQP
jgi:AcrR family transcriptional regulator